VVLTFNYRLNKSKKFQYPAGQARTPIREEHLKTEY